MNRSVKRLVQPTTARSSFFVPFAVIGFLLSMGVYAAVAHAIARAHGAR